MVWFFVLTYIVNTPYLFTITILNTAKKLHIFCVMQSYFWALADIVKTYYLFTM